MLTWARKRQLYYILSVLAFFALVALITFLIYKPAPTCFDQKQNQNEVGVDCGGVCALACSSQVEPLKIAWARALPVQSGWYDLVAQVENLNLKLGIRQASYTFLLYDADNILISKRRGSTFINPGEKLAIFESRVEVGEKQIKRVFLEFDKNLAWEKVPSIPQNIYLERQDFTNKTDNNSGSVLRLAVTNNSLQTFSDLKIITVLSDINRNVFAASATVLDKAEPNSRQTISFTWPEAFPVEPSYIDSYWRVNAFTRSN